VDRAFNGAHNIQVSFNGSSSGDYSYTFLESNGTTVSSTRGSSDTNGYTWSNGDSTTANTYSNNELYFPNYAGATNKVFSVYDVIENNSSTANQSGINARAQLRSNTAAITSILLNTNGFNFLATSSFYLYGIKNS
jgi:hypothetical protein